MSRVLKINKVTGFITVKRSLNKHCISVRKSGKHILVVHPHHIKCKFFDKEKSCKGYVRADEPADILNEPVNIFYLTDVFVDFSLRLWFHFDKPHIAKMLRINGILIE